MPNEGAAFDHLRNSNLRFVQFLATSPWNLLCFLHYLICWSQFLPDWMTWQFQRAFPRAYWIQHLLLVDGLIWLYYQYLIVGHPSFDFLISTPRYLLDQFRQKHRRAHFLLDLNSAVDNFCWHRLPRILVFWLNLPILLRRFGQEVHSFRAVYYSSQNWQVLKHALAISICRLLQVTKWWSSASHSDWNTYQSLFHRTVLGRSIFRSRPQRASAICLCLKCKRSCHTHLSLLSSDQVPLFCLDLVVSAIFWQICRSHSMSGFCRALWVHNWSSWTHPLKISYFWIILWPSV